MLAKRDKLILKILFSTRPQVIFDTFKEKSSRLDQVSNPGLQLHLLALYQLNHPDELLGQVRMFSNQIIKCLNQIISENILYNLRICTFTLHKFQEKDLNLNRDSNLELHESSMAERHTRDLEVRVRIPVQVQIFFLKFM